MCRYLLRSWVLGLFAIVALATWGVTQEPAPPTPETPALANPAQVQPRGPIHEAYAQPAEVQPEPGIAVPKAPPAPVPEMPAEQKPEADNAQWIPGYWSWDSVRQEYVWVSGVYRIPPQGRNYVPGYWAHTDDGWHWVPGLWASDRQREIPYTPEPPASLDVGPSMPAPDANSMYIPGSWVYRGSQFVWRPGYYAAMQTGRVWNPPHYVWTPGGYAYVDGYWDYPVEARGLLFAPVYFPNQLPTDAAPYQPSYVVNPLAFLDSAFVLGPNFYFGNYYGPGYAGLGYRPWYAGAGRYDPLFNYNGWQNNRNNPNWLAGVQRTYANRANGLGLGGPAVGRLNQVAGANQMRVAPASAAQLNTQRALAQQTGARALNRSQTEAARALRTGGTNTISRNGTQVLTFPKGASNPAANGGGLRANSSPAPMPRALTPAATSRGATPALKTMSPSTAPRMTRTTNMPSVNAQRIHMPPQSPARVTAAARTTAHAPAAHAGGHSGGGRRR